MSIRSMNLFQAPAAQTPEYAGPMLERAGARRPSRILVIEDERVLAKNMRMYLSRSGSDVRTAASAAQALEMMATFAPDAVVLDIGLPDVDGLRAYADLARRQGRKIKCVMITGSLTEERARAAQALGVCHVLSKPFRMAELERLLTAADVATVNAPHGASA